MRYFDVRSGLLDRRVFSHTGIYNRENETIFRKHWLFIGPVEWVPQPGDFYTSYMGETPVLLWRDNSGSLRLFVNRCHRSNARLIDTDRGNAETLTCTCHGWQYSYIGDRQFNIPESVARIELFGPFVFGSFNASALPLADQFGDFEWYFPIIADRPAGGVQFYGNRALRSTLRANWKLAAEAYSGDLYRDISSHRGTRLALEDELPASQKSGFQVATPGGAIVVATEMCGALPAEDARAGMTLISATLFPNVSFDGRSHAMHVWHPKGPTETEVHTYCLVGRDETREEKENKLRNCQFRFGPFGLESSDDESIWSSITRSAAAARGVFLLNLQMGLGRERRTNIPGTLSDVVSEMNQRWFYLWWQTAFESGSISDGADMAGYEVSDSAHGLVRNANP